MDVGAGDVELVARGEPKSLVVAIHGGAGRGFVAAHGHGVGNGLRCRGSHGCLRHVVVVAATCSHHEGGRHRQRSPKKAILLHCHLSVLVGSYYRSVSSSIALMLVLPVPVVS